MEKEDNNQNTTINIVAIMMTILLYLNADDTANNVINTGITRGIAPNLDISEIPAPEDVMGITQR